MQAFKITAAEEGGVWAEPADDGNWFVRSEVEAELAHLREAAAVLRDSFQLGLGGRAIRPYVAPKYHHVEGTERIVAWLTADAERSRQENQKP